MSIEYTDYFGTEDQDLTIPPVDTEIDVEEVVTDVEPDEMMGVVYNASKVYLRENPDKESKHIGVLENGDAVLIDGAEDDSFGNGWYHLITASGKEGYMMSEFVKIVE